MSVLFENIEIEEISDVNHQEENCTNICFIDDDNDINPFCDEEIGTLDNNLERQIFELKARDRPCHSDDADKNLLVMLPDGTLTSVEVYEFNNDKCISSSKNEIVNKARSIKKIPKNEPNCNANPRIELKCSFSSCRKICDSFTELLNHKKVHCGPPYICEYCSRKFSNNYSLKSHKRTHTGEKPYPCSETSCGKKFNTSGDLQKHIRTHTGERPFQCELCGKSFTTSNIRKVHMRIHTGEKPYHCKHEGCHRKFSSATNFQNHSRIHTGEKPYVCSFEKCQRRFTEYSSLYKHYLVHSVNKKYVCTFCKRQYKQLSSLNIHINSVHVNVDLKTNSNNESLDRTDLVYHLDNGYSVKSDYDHNDIESLSTEKRDSDAIPLTVIKDPSSEEHSYTAKGWKTFSLSCESKSDVDEDKTSLETENSMTDICNSNIDSLHAITKGSEAILVLSTFTNDSDSVVTSEGV